MFENAEAPHHVLCQSLTAFQKDLEFHMVVCRGLLVNMLTELSPETFENYVVYEGNSKVLYVWMIKALYGMLQSSLLNYKKFWKDI